MADEPAAAAAAPEIPTEGAPAAPSSVSAPAPAPSASPEAGADSPAPPSGDAELKPDLPQPDDDPGLLAATEPEKKPAAEAAPEPPKPDSEAKPEPAKPAEAAPPEPISYAEHPLTLPEGVAIEDARLGEYDAILGQHRIPPEVRQQLADLYAGDVQQMLDRVRRDQFETFSRTRAQWREDCAADPQFGGAAFETHKAAAIRMLDFLVPADEMADFNMFMRVTGAADHPQMFRFLNRIAQHLAEPAPPPSGFRPVPANLAQGEATPRRMRDFYRRRNTE